MGRREEGGGALSQTVGQYLYQNYLAARRLDEVKVTPQQPTQQFPLPSLLHTPTAGMLTNATDFDNRPSKKNPNGILVANGKLQVL